MNKMKAALLTFITFISLISNPSAATTALEVGAGAFYTSLPKYIGSEEQSTYTLPLPYLYYRSDAIEIDRNTFTGFLWQQENWYIDISASGNIPVESDKTAVREGMPDIDFVGELGPKLSYFFIGDPSSKRQFNVSISTRKAFATDFSHLSSVGWRYSTSLAYNSQLAPLFKGSLALNTMLTVNAADNNYLDYYYGVGQQFQTPNRANYQVNTGYSGSSLSVGLTWKKDDFWLGSFLKYNNLQNTSQQDSPLVTAENNWSFGIGFVWVFYKK